MRASRCILVTALLVCGVTARAQAQQRPAPTPPKGGITFRSADVEPVLLRVSRLVNTGFSATDAHALAERIVRIPVHAESTFVYQVTVHGERTQLRIVAVMSGAAAPDLVFFTEPHLESAIDREIGAYFAAAGK